MSRLLTAFLFCSMTSSAALADCRSMLSMLCVSAYEVVEIRSTESGRAQVVVVETSSESERTTGEEFSLTLRDSYRRGDRLLLVDGFPQAEIRNESFEFYGASIGVEDLAELRADPSACVDKLASLGAEEPPCNDVIVGCSGMSPSALALLALLTFYRNRRT